LILLANSCLAEDFTVAAASIEAGAQLQQQQQLHSRQTDARQAAA